MKYFSSGNFWIVAVAMVVCWAVMFFISPRFVQGYQLSSYRYKRFFKWVINTKSKLFLRYTFMSMLGLLIAVVVNSAFYNLIGDYVALFSAFAAIVLTILFIHAESKIEKKTPLKITKRIVRLYIVSSILFLGYAAFSLYFLQIGNSITTAFLFMLSFILAPIFMILASFIIYPFEKLNNYRYIVKARKKLAKNGCKVIAITGSFGKTSVKNILFRLLSSKYKCVVSKDSYNTPMGIAKTILQDLQSDTEFIILEMGARQKGDIEYLCKIAPPYISVITAIGAQHLEYFKTIENIENTKFEIIQNSTKAAFFGESAKKLFERAQVDKYMSDAISNYNVSSSGSSFVIEGIKFNTKLLGKHNVNNIALCLRVCKYLGLNYSECNEIVSQIPQIEHRLQVINADNDITIIDDSYSSNPDAANAAFEVVKAFDGHKILVTPGFIEQGTNTAIAHKHLADEIAATFEKVILIGQNQTKVIYDTLCDNAFCKENIFVVNSLQTAKEMFPKVLQDGSVLLILNDLPDNYTESL